MRPRAGATCFVATTEWWLSRRVVTFQEPQTFTQKIVLDDHECDVNAVAWASHDLLVCAVDNTAALYLGELTADGVYTSTQRIEIASLSALWLAPAGGGGDTVVALCGIAAPVILRLNVDLQRRCVGSTTMYSLEAAAVGFATVVASPSRTDAFVVDALGISRYFIEHVGEAAPVRLGMICFSGVVRTPYAELQVSDGSSYAATDERIVALLSSKFDDIKRLVLQSRAEVRCHDDLMPPCLSREWEVVL